MHNLNCANAKQKLYLSIPTGFACFVRPAKFLEMKHYFFGPILIVHIAGYVGIAMTNGLQLALPLLDSHVPSM